MADTNSFRSLERRWVMTMNVAVVAVGKPRARGCAKAVAVERIRPSRGPAVKVAARQIAALGDKSAFFDLATEEFLSRFAARDTEMSLNAPASTGHDDTHAGNCHNDCLSASLLTNRQRSFAVPINKMALGNGHQI